MRRVILPLFFLTLTLFVVSCAPPTVSELDVAEQSVLFEEKIVEAEEPFIVELRPKSRVYFPSPLGDDLYEDLPPSPNPFAVPYEEPGPIFGADNYVLPPEGPSAGASAGGPYIRRPDLWPPPPSITANIEIFEHEGEGFVLATVESDDDFAKIRQRLQELPYVKTLIVHFSNHPQLINRKNPPQATGAGLAHLAGLTHLEELSLNQGWRMTDDDLAHLAELPGLRVLKFENCSKITDAGLAHLAKLAQLEELELRICWEIKGPGLAHLRELEHLRSLSIYTCNQMTDDGLASLKELTRLEELNISHCYRITDAGLAHLAGLTQMEELHFFACEGITGSGLVYLAGMTQLRTLGLIACMKVTDAELAHLAGMTWIEELYLPEQITDEGLAHLAGITQMRKLSLMACGRITDAGLAHLANMTQMEDLNLTVCNKITDAGLVHLKGMTRMQVLSLRGCKNIMKEGIQNLRESLPECEIDDSFIGPFRQNSIEPGPL